jgi:multisubunit Na+/H+ antiporter MnhG subunit
VLLLLAFLIVLLFVGLGFALHFLWIIAAIFLVLWIIGYAIGRGESAGRRRFYRW